MARAWASLALLAGMVSGAALARAAGPCAPALPLADTSAPQAVVGNGTPASCTEAALASALAGGGIVVFDCGPNPVTIPITSPKSIPISSTIDTVVDGGGLVTLDGGGTSRIFEVPSSFERGWPTLTVQRLAFVRGSSAGVSGDDTARGGGAIWVRGGSLRVIQSSLVDNHGPIVGQDVAGGAVYNVGSGSVTITDSAFSGNSASNGGAIGVLHADLIVANTVITGNAASGNGGNPGNGGNGGGIYSDGVDQVESLCGVRIEGNLGHAFGGGMFRVSNDGVGPMAIDRTSVLSNQIPNQSPSMAGGMYLQGVQIQMTDSTVGWNQASFAGGLFIGPQATTLEMSNSTVAENVALSSLGGGVVIDSVVTGHIRNCTLARNAAPGPTAFAGATTGGTGVVLANTIVDGNSAGNGYNPISCNNALQEGGGNLQWPVARAGGGSDVPGALCSPSITVTASLLGPLQDNGGTTPTILPGPGSPAIGHGIGCPATDQRGLPRNPLACTSGAVDPAPEPAGAAWGAALALAALRRRPARTR